ncbi:hypothetical protein QBC36DRAFT_63643 [Triangularia setosa]|uniref:Diphthine methyltransferase n=1 Tax=Triangularia setosa TaxID=2587417 RepID=A0AAN7A8X6_9PEZI|nr:hypothetical protein QBC36DRAFT_63643 [Podospora setosa]
MEEDSGNLINSIWSQELDLPPSCVEFCPAHPSYFLVGTYNLEKDDVEVSLEKEAVNDDDDDEKSQVVKPKKTQSRNGSILAFQLQDDNSIVLIQTEPQSSALLDLHFNSNEGFRDICATVSSTATLTVFRLSPGVGDNKPLKHLNTMDIASLSGGEISATEGSEILFLSLCWHPSRPDMLAITTNTGYVYLVHLSAWDKGWKLHTEPAITHTLEAWTVNLSPNLGVTDAPDDVSFRIFSGGDDSKLRFGTATWNPFDDLLTETISAVEARGHDAGVTAILPLFTQDDGSELLVTGSYDENVRLFSLAPYGRPKNLIEMGLGGGVWRLKLINLDKTPDDSYHWRAQILASCMHTGPRVVEVLQTADGEHHFRVLGRFEEHKSMNYGSDFHPKSKDKLTVVSTSFYDRLLCLWKLELS